ncbi:hypothetical protein GCM10019016_134560 [Streptomyces prasinosporus]|uniref:Uncharacterized protein n=1 Tax=Streptomyces prasinosporus TaxID=68256 RepID=A0ABP6UIT8_9ACTN
MSSLFLSGAGGVGVRAQKAHGQRMGALPTERLRPVGRSGNIRSRRFRTGRGAFAPFDGARDRPQSRSGSRVVRPRQATESSIGASISWKPMRS